MDKYEMHKSGKQIIVCDNERGICKAFNSKDDAKRYIEAQKKK